MIRFGSWDMSTLTRDSFEDGALGSESHAKYRQFIKRLPKTEHKVLVYYDSEGGFMRLPSCFFKELVLKREAFSGLPLVSHPVEPIAMNHLKVGECITTTDGTEMVILQVSPEYIANSSVYRRLADRLVQDIDGQYTSIEGQFTPLVTAIPVHTPMDKTSYSYLRLTDFTSEHRRFTDDIMKTVLGNFFRGVFKYKAFNRPRERKPMRETQFKLLNTAGTEENIKEAMESPDHIQIIGDNWSPLCEMNTHHICQLHKHSGGTRVSTNLCGEKLEYVSTVPMRGSQKSAGYDFIMPFIWYKGTLYRVEYTIAAGGALEFKTGVSFYCKDNQYLKIIPRHSMGIKKRIRLTNTEAIIDADFAGYDIGISLTVDTSMKAGVHLVSGNRIVQGIISRYDITDDDNADGIRVGSSYF